MARFYVQLEAPFWGLVRDLYYHDKIIEALAEAEQLGGQDSNDLYAEAEVRYKGTQFKLRPWLTVEVITDQIDDNLDQILETITANCEALSQRFEWDHRESTLVAFLPADVEEPWMPGRWGYFVNKVPYDKICLPHHLAFDLPELARTVIHEFMHGITLNLANGHAPRWLSEALSTYAEERDIASSWRHWQSGKLLWVQARELNSIIATDSREEARLRPRIEAYDQACAIAEFLAHLGGDKKIVELLNTIGDESWSRGLRERFLGRSRTDGALHDVYGLHEHEVFTHALDWVRSTPN